MKKRLSEERIRILREAVLHAAPIWELCKQHNVSRKLFRGARFGPVTRRLRIVLRGETLR